MSMPWSWSGGSGRQADEGGWSRKVTEMGRGTDKDEKGKKGGHTMTLPSFIYMAHNYKSEAMEKFLLPHQPDEGNYTSRVAYETTHKAYRCDHTCVMAAHKEWKQRE